MKNSKKMQLTSSEEKRTVEPRGFIIDNYTGGCKVSGTCPDGTPLECKSNIASGCSSTDTSITCVNRYYMSGTVQTTKYSCPDSSGSGSGSGSGSVISDPVTACAGLDEGAPCSWHNGTSEQRGKCMTVGNRTYCVKGAKKKL